MHDECYVPTGIQPQIIFFLQTIECTLAMFYSLLDIYNTPEFIE